MNSFQMSFQISWIFSSNLDTTQSDISISGFSNHLADAFLFGNVVHSVPTRGFALGRPDFMLGVGGDIGPHGSELEDADVSIIIYIREKKNGTNDVHT